ncbi:MAG: uroporphyrinogen III methylase [Gammaproteobacteria bacterium]|nr:uroporphyrinogen III methylase [Gammaproteobacteria bacterium]MCW5582508.1 uroporphyrinogen III methylase [Gammaproteobacteria bacterium]
MTKKGSLVIVGSGIKFMSHLTIEAKVLIEKANKVLYLVNEPAMREWLQTCHSNTQSLEDAYHQHILRQDTYHAITHAILQTVMLEQEVCVVLEGHPSVFAKPALDAVIQAKQAGYTTAILPGISAEDYLFAELHLDPGSAGCQSYEATDFLIHRRAFDGYSHLILWQVSVIGVLENKPLHDHQKNTQVLVDYLSDCYGIYHEVILFEGSQYPHITSRIEKCYLKHLPDAVISRTTTLYVPPIHSPICDEAMLEKLGMKKKIRV